MNIVIVGAGRAGTAFSRALARVGHATSLVHHADPVQPGADVVLLCVPDDHLADVAATLTPSAATVVVHVAGSRGLDVLGDHPRVASMHPLAMLNDPERGAQRLLGATYCVEGDEVATALVRSLGGTIVRVASANRVHYHCAATVAASHTVALLAHLEVLAERAALDLQDYLSLVRQALDDVAVSSPRAALTGPVTRGDDDTLNAHVRALDDDERAVYLALAARARRLVTDVACNA